MRLLKSQTGNEYRNRPDKELETGANLDLVQHKTRNSVIIIFLVIIFSVIGYTKHQALNNQISLREQATVEWNQLKSHQIGTFHSDEIPDGHK